MGKRLRSITGQLSVNYTQFLVISLLLFFISSGFANRYLFTNYQFITQEQLNSDAYVLYSLYNVESAANYLNIGDNGSILILNPRLEVKDYYNSAYGFGDKLTTRQFNRIVLSGEKYASYYYDETNMEFMLVIYPNDYFTNSSVDSLILQGGVFLFSISIALLVFSRATSRQIVNPIADILYGINNYRKGDYSNRIPTSSSKELAHLAGALNEMAEQINTEKTLREEATRSRKQLILDISHDMKTPLTSISGYAETINVSEITDEELMRASRAILSSSNRANQLLQDLFDLSLLDMTQYKMDMKLFDICELLRVQLIDYLNIFHEKEFETQFDIPEHPIYVYGDEKRLSQVFDNLISNTLKYAADGHYIRVNVYTSVKNVNISFIDKGPGIPKAFQESIFEPLVRVDSSRDSSIPGNGLGLSIVKKILELHQGRIEFIPQPNGGSTFVIRIPMKIIE